MGIFDKLVDRILSSIGFDLDFTIELRGEAFNSINESLVVGRRPQKDGIQALKEAGITHVVSCLAESERPKMLFLQDDFPTLFLPIHDGVHENISSLFPRWFDYVSQAKESHSKAKVYVHCEVGVSRSATMAIALLMKEQSLDFLEAFTQVRSKRPGVLPNIGFASQLQHYELELKTQANSQRDFSSLALYLHKICNTPIEIELLEEALQRHDYDAFQAIQNLFGGEIPRVVQGVRI